MKKYLVMTTNNVKLCLYMRIAYDRRAIIVYGDCKDNIKEERYSFDNIEEFVNNYGREYFIRCDFGLKKKCISISKPTVINFINEYKEYYNDGYWNFIYLYGYEAVFMNKKYKNMFFMEMLKFNVS